MQAKPKPKLTGLAKTFHNVLSASSSNHAEPQLVHEEEVASCSGNWLSHLDWNGVRYCGGTANQWNTRPMCSLSCILMTF